MPGVMVNTSGRVILAWPGHRVFIAQRDAVKIVHPNTQFLSQSNYKTGHPQTERQRDRERAQVLYVDALRVVALFSAVTMAQSGCVRVLMPGYYHGGRTTLALGKHTQTDRDREAPGSVSLQAARPRVCVVGGRGEG